MSAFKTLMANRATRGQRSSGHVAAVEANKLGTGLKLEPFFQQKALDNMRAGGKYKGLGNLPEAGHIDVRQEIAGAAGVGARNVSNEHRLNLRVVGHSETY